MGFTQTIEEAKAKKKITPANVWKVSRRASLRMQLHVTGETHRRLLKLTKSATGAVLAEADTAGKLDSLGYYRATRSIEREWANFYNEWKKFFFEMLRAAASIPFGILAVYHNEWLLPQIKSQKLEGKSQTLTPTRVLQEEDDSLDYVFDPQLQQLMDAAQRRIYQDGLHLSQRLWRLDQQSLGGIKQVLANGIAEGKSAWDIAKQLEQYLGANAECPRWTSTRLGKLTKADIASGDRRGLLTGDECTGAGVAYNALRLARNEIQAMHALATDALMARMPWVEKEEVRLSADHAERDECDGVAGGSPYPKGTILLPIHVHCLCYKVAVLMKPDEFVKDLRGWMRGEKSWAQMDEYQRWLGGEIERRLSGAIFNALYGWAFGAVR